MKQRTYIAIDLKSFYASVECRERGLDPLDTNLVVADESRTDKTICLAVTPSLKSYGISGRGRLFEVKQRVKEANAGRQHDAPGHRLEGSSYLFSVLQENPSLAIDFIIAPPRMAYYMEYSTRIYQVYMKYVAPEDIIVYSIDEVFMDVTDYLNTYKLSPHDLAMKIILDVLSTTGITATAGIGTNLYLCKVAMDIVAKHIPADKNGVRIAELNEMSYRETLWSHQPLTDFWRVGKGYAKKLEENGMFTMGDVARRSVTDEDLLYKLFGKNAELLIDHAWGWEPCTVEAVKAYKPESNSLGSGQVLHQPYEADKAAIWNDSDSANNWKYVAETAASRILAKNPNVLIMVEGTEIYQTDIKSNKDFISTNDDDYYFNWWGGNLRGVKDFPVDLGKYQNKLVYSPHDYGPTVYQQPWFEGDYDFDSLMRDCWQDNWFFIYKNNTAPLLIGEWGGFMKEPNLKWMTCMRRLISENHLNHTFWCYNANSGDTGGLVLDDFSTWDEEKYAFVKEVLWQENGKFVGLDHKIALGENGITLKDAKGL